MNLSDFYPKPTDLIANEVKTLQFLSTNTYIQSEHSAFWANVYHLYTQLRYGKHRDFDFSSQMEIRHAQLATAKNSQTNLQIIVGGLVTIQSTGKSYSHISYSLVVGKLHSDPKTLMRKFHFDITTSTSHRQPHPLCHLQYCGSAWPYMETLGYKKSQVQALHLGLDEPRIFFWPMSLALLLDMVFREFPDNKSAKFVESPEWKNIIRENEKLLLYPFHQKCSAIINSSERQRKTLADEFYIV